MSRIAYDTKMLTCDPDTEREIFFIFGCPNRSKLIEIRGDNFQQDFTASLIDEPITILELQRLGVPDVYEWRAYGRRSPEQWSVITPAFSVTQSGQRLAMHVEAYSFSFEAKGESFAVADLTYTEALGELKGTINPMDEHFQG